MRHATDPDHVIAVTTTVSRERRLGSAALVGAGSLAFTAGILSVGFGLFLAYHTGFVGGLFTGEYRWTPQ